MEFPFLSARVQYCAESTSASQDFQGFDKPGISRDFISSGNAPWSGIDFPPQGAQHGALGHEVENDAGGGALHGQEKE
jgi:hypothetical protein